MICVDCSEAVVTHGRARQGAKVCPDCERRRDMDRRSRMAVHRGGPHHKRDMAWASPKRMRGQL